MASYHNQSILGTHNPIDKQSLSIGSISSLPIIITASVALLAVDATITLFRKCTAHVAPEPQPHHESITRFVDKTRAILADVQALEKQLNQEKGRRVRLASRRRTVGNPERCLIVAGPSGNHEVTQAATSYAFAAFCERLLLTNRIWRQEKELKALRIATAAKTRVQHGTAFNTFCDQLLLWNRIWKLEREAGVLVEEKERIRRERVSAVTRAAKRMVVDVQKERMVEEFVKDLVDEIGGMKKELSDLRAEHERELEEIQGDWIRDYRRVLHELERLRLAQEARLVEQDVSNAMEESLFESLREGRRRIEALEDKIAAYTLFDGPTLNDVEEISDDDEATDVELDEMSTTSTCVSSGGSIRRQTPENALQRRRCMSMGTPPSVRKSRIPHRTLSVPDVPDASTILLRPLLNDQAKSVSDLSRNLAIATRTCNHSGRPLAVRNRTTSSVSFRSALIPIPLSGSTAKSGFGGILPKRAPWRV